METPPLDREIAMGNNISKFKPRSDTGVTSMPRYVRMGDTLALQVKTEAKKRNMTFSKFMRQAVIYAMDNME